jgi:hypothetical protein
MKRNLLVIPLFLALVILNQRPIFGQITNPPSDTLRKEAVKIFLDCQSCDMNYTREKISFANFVRDVNDAQVFILVNQQNAGSGAMGGPPQDND